MQQAGTYGGGGTYAPSGQIYLSTAPPTYELGELNLYGSAPASSVYGPPSYEPAYVPQEAQYASQENSYNPNLGYSAPQPSYAPAVPSYSPRAPSYENYNSSAPLASTSPAEGQGYLTGNNVPAYSDGGFGGGIQSYGSGGVPAAPSSDGAVVFRQVEYDQSGYSNIGYEQGGYASQGGRGVNYEGRGYEREGYNSQRDSSGPAFNNSAYDDGGYAEVYAYDGGRGHEPYGAHGTGGSSWNVGGTVKETSGYGGSTGSQLARATPKVDTSDTSGGVQKYRVKMLPDMSSSTSKDVICQIGLDGVRMVDPATSRTLRIYPLDTITRWEVNEPSVFTFWAKSAVDIEQRSIRLQSSAYTTNAILDTITAACVQLCEMVGKDGADKATGGTSATSDLSVQRKNSIADWVSIRPRILSEEEKQHWVPDEAATKCSNCDVQFSAFYRRHHCRNCGDIFCDRCTRGRTPLTAEEGAQVVRVCDRCLAEVTQRLTNAKDTSKAPVQRSHADLAKKLQEELERNAGRKETSSSIGATGGSGNRGSGTSVLNCNKCGSITLVTGSESRCPSCGSEAPANTGNSYGSVSQSPSHGSGPRMREVACPICTVHLQVQVPSHGTETVECGVCQHPFLVTA